MQLHECQTSFGINVLIIEPILHPKLLVVSSHTRNETKYKTLPSVLVSKNIHKNCNNPIVTDAAQPLVVTSYGIAAAQNAPILLNDSCKYPHIYTCNPDTEIDISC